MAQGKCIWPRCKVTGEVVPGRPFACEHHTRFLVAGYHYGMKGAKSLLAATAARYAKKKAPWWLRATLEGLTEE